MKLLAPVIIVTALIVGCTNARVVHLSGIPGVNSSTLSASIDEGVATVTGQVNTGSEKRIARQHVAQMEGVVEVIDLISIK